MKSAREVASEFNVVFSMRENWGKEKGDEKKGEGRGSESGEPPGPAPQHPDRKGFCRTVSNSILKPLLPPQHS
ncbi:hypothetical protein RUM44_001858 [Polyplax serrata]|uniref:Uncharacterized protein n=1 Tax=Polyplax serrata TaxID=468196 RepID=A0ABR1AL89_POLSC